MTDSPYLQFYDLEGYLFNTVHPRFHAQRFLSAFDFFCIVIWKANRSKSIVARRLLAHTPSGELKDAVYELTSGTFSQPTAKERLRYLSQEWSFRLPMASAILTVLYPDEFTVYDYRVCECLGGFYTIGNTSNFDKLWASYVQFRHAVINSTPPDLSLRDKDRYLWAKSFADQLTDDLAKGFRRGAND